MVRFALTVLALVAGGGSAMAETRSDAVRLRDAAFSRPAAKSHALGNVASRSAADPALDRRRLDTGQDLAAWRSDELMLGAASTGAVDSLRLSIAAAPPAGFARVRLDSPGYEAEAFDVTLMRRWPHAVRFRADKLAVEVAPHAGIGVSSLGGQAEGGATVTVSKSREDTAVARLREMGVRDGASFGDTGRWYLFAAASGRAVGLNMLRSDRGWDRAGWTTDPTGQLVGDAQIGVGWRKGDMQSSFGVVHREVKGQHMVFGQMTRDDTMAAFTFSLRPGR